MLTSWLQDARQYGIVKILATLDRYMVVRCHGASDAVRYRSDNVSVPSGCGIPYGVNDPLLPNQDFASLETLAGRQK